MLAWAGAGVCAYAVLRYLSPLLTPQKECPGNREVAPGKDDNSIEGMTTGSTVIDSAPDASSSLGQALPLVRSQLDELAPQRLEVGGTVVVLDVLRVMRDGVDQPVP